MRVAVATPQGVCWRAPVAPAARRYRQLAAPSRSDAARWRRRAQEGAAAGGSGSGVGVVIECDGAIIDAQVDGHREAFNRAFSEVGHDCTNWSPAVFYDLMRLGDGTGEGLIAAYYQIRGWPMMLASKERGAFLKTVHAAKVRILREMAGKGEVPLRPGVSQFLDDALMSGARVVVVAATASVPEDGLISSAMFNLGPNRAFQLQVVTMGGSSDGDGSGSSSSSDEEGQPPALTFDQQVQAAQAKAKSQAAQNFVRAYNLQKAAGMGVQVDSKMMAAAERAGLITPQYMAALAATLGVSPSQTMVVAAGLSLLEAGKSAGMLTLAVPPGMAMRGRFTAADAVFDGYGPGGGLTWHKANLILNKLRQQ